MYFSLCLDVVQYAENILKQIYEGIKITNIDTAIQDSRRILDQIKATNFSGNAEECSTEEGLAREGKNLNSNDNQVDWSGKNRTSMSIFLFVFK